jgi:hypothetical protein
VVALELHRMRLPDKPFLLRLKADRPSRLLLREVHMGTPGRARAGIRESSLLVSQRALARGPLAEGWEWTGRVDLSIRP